jgi:Tol biopolymer transport system component
VPLEGDRKPIPLLQSPFVELFPQVSPDGQWLAYQSNETGRAEIYIKPFPDGSGKWQVSTEGGGFPRWGRGGKELYFAGPAQSMWMAEIRIAGSAPEPGVPQSLFTIPANPSTAFNQHVGYHRYAVTADGERFLLSAAGGAAAGSGGLAATVAAAADQGGIQNVGISPNGVTVVVNWARMMDVVKP